MSSGDRSLSPLALLIGLDKSEQVVTVTEPPPPEWLVPRPVRWHVTPEDEPQPPQMTPMNHRVFTLQRHMRAPKIRWFRVYNEGRSMTPEAAYVYFEKKL